MAVSESRYNVKWTFLTSPAIFQSIKKLDGVMIKKTGEICEILKLTLPVDDSQSKRDCVVIDLISSQKK